MSKTNDKFNEALSSLGIEQNTESMSFNAAGLESIESMIHAMDDDDLTSKLNTARAIHQIKETEIYKQADCSSFRKYLQISEHRLGLPYSTAYEYAQMGAGYERIKLHGSEAGISEEFYVKNQTKLGLVEKALKNNGNNIDLVVEHFLNDTARKFKEFAKGPTKEAKREGVKDKKTQSHKKPAPSGVPTSDLSEAQREVIRCKILGLEPFVRGIPDQSFASEVIDAIETYRKRIEVQAQRRLAENPRAATGLICGAGDIRSLEELEARIRNELRLRTPNKVTIALLVYLIDTTDELKRAVRCLGFTTTATYARERLGLDDRYTWYREIGEAVYHHHALVGELFRLDPNAGLYKLAHLEKARRYHRDDNKVRTAFRRYSYREFKAFAKGIDPEPGDVLGEYVSASLIETYEHLWRFIHTIEERGEYPLVIGLREPIERMVVSTAISKLQWNLREQTQSGEEQAEKSA